MKNVTLYTVAKNLPGHTAMVEQIRYRSLNLEHSVEFARDINRSEKGDNASIFDQEYTPVDHTTPAAVAARETEMRGRGGESMFKKLEREANRIRKEREILNAARKL